MSILSIKAKSLDEAVWLIMWSVWNQTVLHVYCAKRICAIKTTEPGHAFPTNCMCAQHRPILACAFAQSDQSLRTDGS